MRGGVENGVDKGVVVELQLAVFTHHGVGDVGVMVDGDEG